MMPGPRTITRNDPRTAPRDGQWVGQAEADPQRRLFSGRSIERVIERLTEAFGPCDETEYRIVEKPPCQEQEAP